MSAVVAASFWSTPTAPLVVGLLVGAAVFVLGWLLFGTAARARKDREMAARMASVTRPNAQPTSADSGTGGWIPDRVTSYGKRFADARGFSERVDAELEAAGVSVRSGEFVVLSVAAALIGAVLGAALLRSPLLALLVGAVAGAGPTLALKMAMKRRAEKLREQLPDVLTIMASSLRAGHSFMQSLDTVAREITQPAATEFQRVVAEIRLGRGTDEALDALATRVGSADFRWAVLAVNIQREVGGNLAEILDSVADTLRERATMRRQIRVLTSEGRLSAWVLAVLPCAIAIYMFAVNPKYIMLLVTTKLGLIMLATAGTLLVVRDPLDEKDREYRCMRSCSFSPLPVFFFSVLLVGIATRPARVGEGTRGPDARVAGCRQHLGAGGPPPAEPRGWLLPSRRGPDRQPGGTDGQARSPRSTRANGSRRSCGSPATRRDGTPSASSPSR